MPPAEGGVFPMHQCSCESQLCQSAAWTSADESRSYASILPGLQDARVTDVFEACLVGISHVAFGGTVLCVYWIQYTQHGHGKIKASMLLHQEPIFLLHQDQVRLVAETHARCTEQVVHSASIGMRSQDRPRDREPFRSIAITLWQRGLRHPNF